MEKSKTLHAPKTEEAMNFVTNEAIRGRIDQSTAMTLIMMIEESSHECVDLIVKEVKPAIRFKLVSLFIIGVIIGASITTVIALFV